MAKARDKFENDWDDTVHHYDMDVESFIEDVESRGVRKSGSLSGKRSNWRLIEEMRDARALRDTLSDWDSYDD